MTTRSKLLAYWFLLILLVQIGATSPVRKRRYAIRNGSQNRRALNVHLMNKYKQLLLSPHFAGTLAAGRHGFRPGLIDDRFAFGFGY